MVIQSKKVWLADQFVPAAIEVNDGRITAILPYGTKDVDDDYGDKRIVPGFMDPLLWRLSLKMCDSSFISSNIGIRS